MRMLFFIILTLLCFRDVRSQNVGIGNSSPQAALDVSSTTNGFLPPRMTYGQRCAIEMPVQGLIIYCTDCGIRGELQIYDGLNWTVLTQSIANISDTVKICNQVWKTRNLDVATYKNGDIIPQVIDSAEWANLTTGAWCWFNNDSTNFAFIGKLYNWYAINDPRDLAPTGWHIPTDLEWTSLTNCLGGEAVAGGKMKSVSELWLQPNNGASNISGFTGFPSQYRSYNGAFYLGLDGYAAYYWSSTLIPIGAVYAAWYRMLYFSNINIVRNNHHRNMGFSIRCVKD